MTEQDKKIKSKRSMKREEPMSSQGSGSESNSDIKMPQDSFGMEKSNNVMNSQRKNGESRSRLICE
jgi:hypothetical protein